MARKIMKKEALSNYFSNLLFALLAKNPVREELERMRMKCRKNEEEVNALRDLYYKCQEQWGESERKLMSANRQVADLQVLVENLRENIAVKERNEFLTRCDYQKRVREMKESHQHQIDMYAKEIYDLRK